MLVSAAKTALQAYGFDTNDPLNVWLDAGIHEFERAYDWPFLQVRASVVVNAGVAALVLPGTAFKVMSIRDTTVGRVHKLKYMDVVGFEDQIDDPTQQGTPTNYTVLTGNTVQIWPVPDTNTTFSVIYQDALADTGADGTNMPGPVMIHYTCVMHSAYLALQADNEEDRAKTAQDQAQQAVWRIIRKYRANLDSQRQVQDSMGYGRP